MYKDKVHCIHLGSLYKFLGGDSELGNEGILKIHTRKLLSYYSSAVTAVLVSYADLGLGKGLTWEASAVLAIGIVWHPHAWV